MLARKFILKKKEIDSGPELSDFEIVTEIVRDVCGEGEVLIRAEFLSPDPHVRGGGLEGKPFGLLHGGEIPGGQVGRVVASNNPLFPTSSLVYGFFGWRDLTLYKPGKERSWKSIYRLPSYFENSIHPSFAIGAVGMPGITAYYAVEKILEIKKGGTLVVSTATGAVGNMVLQIGKLKGCKTLVFTSTDAKVIWLKTLGAGYIFNYNKINAQQVFSEFAPEGIDFYFDNIGGEFTFHVMRNMKEHGRIAVCDAISCYGDDGVMSVPFDYLNIVDKRIRLEGFSVYELGEVEWAEAMSQMAQWIDEGKIKVEETIMEGFDKMPQAFLDRYHGKVVGMQVVRNG